MNQKYIARLVLVGLGEGLAHSWFLLFFLKMCPYLIVVGNQPTCSVGSPSWLIHTDRGGGLQCLFIDCIAVTFSGVQQRSRTYPPVGFLPGSLLMRKQKPSWGCMGSKDYNYNIGSNSEDFLEICGIWWGFFETQFHTVADRDAFVTLYFQTADNCPSSFSFHFYCFILFH